MKKLTILLAIMLVASLTTKATQITVCNDLNIPAQYSNLQTAADAASQGDTLLISGTATSYGYVTLNKGLTLIGAGAFFPTGSGKQTTKVLGIYLIQASTAASASNSKIYGIEVANYIYFQGGFSGSTFSTGGIRGVLIEKCKITSGLILQNAYGNATHEYDTIRNNIISGNISIDNSPYLKLPNFFIVNNIMDGARISGVSNTSYIDSLIIRNNVFINRTSSVFITTPHLVIENNIFYGSEPSVINTSSGVTFNNNICYGTTAIMPGTANLGTGNINNTNPLFVNYPIQGGAFDCAYDFALQTGSPAINAGTDGSDIGLTGGFSPYYNYCNGHRVPTMIWITMPANANAAPLGGTLNVTFKAKKQD